MVLKHQHLFRPGSLGFGLKPDRNIGSSPGAKVLVAQPCAERFNIVGVSEHIIG
ncbi:hypothetical protein [Daejeonella sp.]|uniref:hypothetical protein n=1 Tax=Daejeonella sp. TaxID=2805397 RepID=UPI00272F013B|nr:hypothetical protein [Daejeonella sp.]MDP2415210.1 hypothetical protein [Daejeonella sp.]